MTSDGGVVAEVVEQLGQEDGLAHEGDLIREVRP